MSRMPRSGLLPVPLRAAVIPDTVGPRAPPAREAPKVSGMGGASLGAWTGAVGLGVNIERLPVPPSETRRAPDQGVRQSACPGFGW